MSEKAYLRLLSDAVSYGSPRPDRTGTGTRSLFARQLRFDLSKGFPLLTTKSVHFKSVAVELLWFLRGNTNTDFLHEHGVSIWDEWADEDGNLGRIYGAQWRAWEREVMYSMELKLHDQIAAVQSSLYNDQFSRRHLVSAWNVGELVDMALPPCHYSFQFYVTPATDGGANFLSCIFNMRSTDIFLGLPFNIASYALLTHLMAETLGFRVGELVYSGADVHLYENHIEQALTQIQREPREFPKLQVHRKHSSVWEYELDDFEVIGYDPHPKIPAPVAV